jgi:HK97 family phage major capsid protein
MKEKWQKLFAQAKEKLAAAKALLEADGFDASNEESMAQVTALREEAEALQKQAREIKAVSDALGIVNEPQMPGALPTDPEPGELPPGGEPNAAVKAVYQIRYGEPDAAIKAILTDLHGQDFEAKRWAQWQAFNRYIRGGPEAFKAGDAALLREVVFTPDLVALAIKQGQDVAALKTTMVEASDTLGGYVVPSDFQSDVIRRMAGLTIMRGRARVSQTSRDRAEFVKITGGGSQYPTAVRVTAVDETPTAGTAATNLTFGKEVIPVHTVMAETFLSRNLVEDAAFNLAEELATAFSEGSAIQEDNWFLTGDGNGRPQGLLPSSSNDLSLTEAVTGHASLLNDYDALIDLVYSIDSQYRQSDSCAFVAEKATYKTIAKLKDGESRYLWDRTERMNGKLEGFTYLEQEAMATIAAEAYVMLFGDLRGYRIVDRVGMTIERYLDSSPARQNLILFLMRRRFGGQCVETWRFGVLKVSAS